MFTRLDGTLPYQGTEEEKREKAVADVREYLGEERFEMLTESIASGNFSDDFVDMVMGVAGIQGYPVHAMLETYKAKKVDEPEEIGI